MWTKVRAWIVGWMAILLSIFSTVWAEPIRAHPRNPHYLLYRNEPTILITSAEHYGAMIKLDFDYVAYFDALKAHQLNYTRIYPGAMFEPVGKFMPGNTLGPPFLATWHRSMRKNHLHNRLCNPENRIC